MADTGGAAAPLFEFHRLRFRFQAVDSIYFPHGKPGNIIRGAFGIKLRTISCSDECPGARACPRGDGCPYTRIFEPGARAAGPSGLADWPRPFVFRALHLDGQTVRPGGTFHFDVHLFDLSNPLIPHYIAAFDELAKEGLGPGRGRAALAGIDFVDFAGRPVAPLHDGTALVSDARLHSLIIPLTLPPNPVSRLRIAFLSPVELKHENHLASRPDFGILFGRIRDRIATLTNLYGAGPIALDFAAIGARASNIRMTHCDIQHVDVERRSSRTGQRHPIGGFRGVAEYEGDLTEFIPWVTAATYAGVGRQTTFGNGEIRIVA